MSELEAYDIHPEDFYKSLWLTPLYTLGAAIVTSLFLLFLGEALSELFIIFSCVYGLIGFAPGYAVKRCLGPHPIAPGYIVAMGWAILGIAACQFTSIFIGLAFFVGMPLGEAFMASLFTLPENASMNLLMATSFEDPITSMVLFAQPLIALAITWQTLRSED